MSSVSPPVIDRVIDGRYRVESHLAEGGMASVYRALDLRLDRPVALKVMRPDLARDPEFVSRFRREARSAARLSHPHVVSVFDQGSDGDLVFLTMELVQGRTLRDLLAGRAPLTVREAAGITDQILQALSAAHRAGIVHRDIKPENVLMTPSGEVKVADFGLARAVSASSMSRTSDLLWGTAAYLSPEQVEHGRSDERTDVYAVALLLYEMLTGVKAFPGESPVHVAFQHVHGEVPRPSELVPTVPAEIDALVAMAGATDPQARPVDAAALRRELQRALGLLSEEELDDGPARVPPADGHHPAVDHDVTRPVHHPTAVVPLGARSSQHPSPGPTGTDHFARTTGNRRPETPGAGATVPPSAPRRRRGGRALGVLLTVLLLSTGAAGAGAAWWFGVGPGVHSAVPAVVGLNEQEAVAALDGLQLDPVVTREYSETAPEGVVTAAGAEEGDSLRHGTDVALTVSRGPERYAVPDLLGRTAEEAEAALAEVNLVLGQTSEAFDATVPTGQVLRVQPAVGAELRRDSTVDVVLSAGREPLEVAQVVGRPEQEAVQVLSDQGFEVTVVPEPVYDATVPAGAVAFQSPAQGTGFRGDTVTLTLSRGPELVTVPDVVGASWSEVEGRLTTLGLVVTKEEIAQAFFGTVRFQSIAGGEQVPVGTEIVITVL